MFFSFTFWKRFIFLCLFLKSSLFYLSLQLDSSTAWGNPSDQKNQASKEEQSSDIFCKSRPNSALKADQKVLKVEGMVCAFCIQGIEIHLKKLSGIDQIKVNLEEGEVKLQVKPNQSPSSPDLCEAIKRAGYKVTWIEHPALSTDSKSIIPTVKGTP